MQYNELSVIFTTEVREMKNALLFPSSPNVILKIRKSAAPSFEHCLWGRAGRLRFASGMCAKAPKEQICPKTFVHDCS